MKNISHKLGLAVFIIIYRFINKSWPKARELTCQLRFYLPSQRINKLQYISFSRIFKERINKEIDKKLDSLLFILLLYFILPPMPNINFVTYMESPDFNLYVECSSFSFLI